MENGDAGLMHEAVTVVKSTVWLSENRSARLKSALD